jgi:hypothetical protein
MNTRKNPFKNLDGILITMIGLNVLYFLFSLNASNDMHFHQDSLFKFLVVWNMLQAMYSWNLASMFTHSIVKWVLFPLSITALTFFTLLATPFGVNISGNEAQLLFIPFYLLCIPLHLLSKATCTNRAIGSRLGKIVLNTFIFAILSGVGFLLYLNQQFSPQWLMEEIIIDLIFIGMVFSLTLTIFLGVLHILHRLTIKQHSIL